MTISDRVKDSVSLRDLAERRGVLWDTAKSQPVKGDYWAPCPFHSELTPSFHVVEPSGTGGFFKCFGCQAKGSVIDFLILSDGLTPKDAIKALADDAGLEKDPDPVEEAKREAERKSREEAAAVRFKAKAESRWKGAKLMWNRARREADIVWDYLRNRGVNMDALGHFPPTLRHVPDANFWAEGQNRRKEKPAHKGSVMLAAIGRGRLVGVHRTWITAEGRARLPDGTKVDKKWLGRTGDMYGQPVKFSPTSPTMIVGEGIETTLAAWTALLAAGECRVSAEAALTRGALADGSWQPPEGVDRVILLAEGSSKKPQEAEDATHAAVGHIEAAGVQVRVVLPGGRWDRDVDAADIAKEFMA